MQCPVCENLLRRETHQHVEFDVCAGCKGIWVSGEQFRGLAALVAAEGNVKSSAKLTFQPRKVLRTLPQNKALARKCPHCDTTMKEFNYAYDSNVFLDRCGQCQGIWLDPNEIIDIARHIQYNPELDAAARGLIHDDGSIGETENEKCVGILAAVFMILRVLVFRR